MYTERMIIKNNIILTKVPKKLKQLVVPCLFKLHALISCIRLAFQDSAEYRPGQRRVLPRGQRRVLPCGQRRVLPQGQRRVLPPRTAQSSAPGTAQSVAPGDSAEYRPGDSAEYRPTDSAEVTVI